MEKDDSNKDIRSLADDLAARLDKIRDGPPKVTSFANILSNDKPIKKINFRTLRSAEQLEDTDFVLPIEAIAEVKNKFANSLFASLTGLEQVLEQGPWLIRNVPLILNKWTPDLALTKDNVTKVPVWAKIHKVPVVAYTEDGLSLIRTQIGKPIMLDTFTSSMCGDTWGRMGYGMVCYDDSLIEVSLSGQGTEQEVVMDVLSKMYGT
ncbi:hypothetical protein Tco_1029190 [Tanacetum coccineum]|uniref:DUF4283 domain-containing protein n=1 Tax=Tanacetum coccineum TaxID=301880 RepID=A0ABQ5G4A9_9ASTR